VIIERNKVEAAIASEAARRPGASTADICEAVATSLGIPTGLVFEVADDCMKQLQEQA
jgi:hypothetical protein